MRLRDYARKRDFAATPEPSGRGTAAVGDAAIFVIQLHHARARHFDFRLQVGNTLRSWAVPKGPSLRTTDKRLAVEVEDHPLDYAGFSGHIPAGHYGGGHVRIADRGTWEPGNGDPRRALKAGKLVLRLHGDRLQGEWTLVRTARQQGGKPQWLLIKHADAFVADTDLDTMLGSPGPEPAAATGTPSLAGARRGHAAPEPQLATRVESAPDGDAWLHEVKWDGYRLLMQREGGRLRLLSRNGNDWSGRFPALEKALQALPAGDFLLDGELVVLDDGGYSDFAALQRALEAGDDRSLQVIVFDLLQYGDFDLRGVALLQRKELLRTLLGKRRRGPLWYGEHLLGNGPRIAARCIERGFEGIVSKRADAPYRAGRGRDWLKVKREDGFDATIVGFTAPRGSRPGLGSLLLAVRESGDWRYVGRVGSGLGDARLLALRNQLDGLRVDAPVLALPAHVPLSVKAVHWVRPELMVEVAHRGWGKEGLLRQAAFRRLRADKSPPPATAQARKATKVAETGPAVDGIRLSSPDRVVYPDAGVRKRDVFAYYAAIAERLLPAIVDRPLSLLRAPDGVGGPVFFQKHAGAGMDAMPTMNVREKSGRDAAYLVVRDRADLLRLVQFGAIEFHPWGVRPGQPERPDRIVFDLDPGEGVAWKAVVAAARDVRARLQAVGLESVVLASGGKGLHVIVPLSGRDGWDAVKRFARAVAEVMATQQPQRFIAVAAKDRRRGRIFIDWLRNGRGATSVAAWSLRARPGAPVAMPLGWDEVGRLRSGAQFDLAAALRRARGARAEPWDGWLSSNQALPNQQPGLTTGVRVAP